jgi:diguanylate cyclase (GGDEF)-like protein
VALERGGFPRLPFPPVLEETFEADTRESRSYRMWLEGLPAILLLNVCLVLDYAAVKDLALLAIVKRTAVVTPLALFTNWLVRRNPRRWLREGSVAVTMVVICYFNLIVEGNARAASALFGEINVLITALFVGVVMRLRVPYAVSSIFAMTVGGLWSLGHAAGLTVSERSVGSSMMLIGIGIILVASYSLEREERRSYLFHLQRDLEAADLASANEVLQRLSGVDKLTSLPNRRALEERIELLWNDCARTGSALSVVLIDVDNFKLINDVYGHLYGDEVLRRIGILLPQVLRSPEDLAARFGGEEFVLLLANTPEDSAMIVAERARVLMETVGTPPKLTSSNETLIWTTVSCGVSSCVPNCGCAWTTLIAAADEALYAAKRGGRNRLEFRRCVEVEVGRPRSDQEPPRCASVRK